ncbi:MAG: NUDIX hydrolase, partial [Woeseiaceae bacterium]|nr:NUDIX hydrolase [Woeseiaceae bacterium]
MAYTYDYPHPAVTVDIVIFTVDGDDLKVLLIKRAQDPFKDQ